MFSSPVEISAPQVQPYLIIGGLTRCAQLRKSTKITTINAANLSKAMDRTPITATQLAREVGVSLTYMCDIRAGRRNLFRNPALRRRIAEALNVPQHWIEND